ncbi:MAG: LysR family transcriptional regulator [Oceanospirillaceae bacterium]
MDKFSLLKQFMCVVEQGGFAAAAKELGQSPSTISKSIARLESHLSIKLFHRTTRQVKLTTAGSDYLSTVSKMLSTLDETERQLRKGNDEYKGMLRVNLPISYGRLYVLPLIAKFNQRYPQISLKLSFDDRYVDMLEKGIDLTIRTGALEETNLIARKISPIDFLICASTQYFQAHPVTVNNLADHPWIRFKYQQSGRLLPIFLDNLPGNQAVEKCQQYVVDDGEALATLCAQGLGLTQIPHFIARDWLRDGRLKLIAPYYRSPKQGVYAVYSDREYLPAKVRAFVDFLIEQMEQDNESAYQTWVETVPVASANI